MTCHLLFVGWQWLSPCWQRASCPQCNDWRDVQETATATVKCCGEYRVLPIQRRGRHTFAKCPACGLCWHERKRAVARNEELRATGGMGQKQDTHGTAAQR